ncbi:MAG: peptidylprolyl isomerase [Candidatus Brocadiales bacterium]|nr:peptidylprolyl isomerase [Candidatus Brocadiales bacterium]
MAQAKHGDTVKVHYTGKLDDGTVFDTSNNREPLQFTIGDGQLIPGFEHTVVGMNTGESRTINIQAEDAYGLYHKEMVGVVDRDQFPPDLEVKVGQQFNTDNQDGRTIIVTVINVSESNVTLDANHPLAGKDLTFDINLVEIV